MRWILYEDSTEVSEQDLQKHANEWVAHMNKIVWGSYFMAEVKVAANGEPAQFRVEYTENLRQKSEIVPKIQSEAPQAVMDLSWEERIDNDMDKSARSHRDKVKSITAELREDEASRDDAIDKLEVEEKLGEAMQND